MILFIVLFAVKQFLKILSHLKNKVQNVTLVIGDVTISKFQLMEMSRLYNRLQQKSKKSHLKHISIPNFHLCCAPKRHFFQLTWTKGICELMPSLGVHCPSIHYFFSKMNGEQTPHPEGGGRLQLAPDNNVYYIGESDAILSSST